MGALFVLAAMLPVAGGPAFGAEEFLRQSIRVRGMGNAFTAVANDEYALFYNPAGLQAVPVYMFEIGSLEGTANQTLIDVVGNALGSASNDELVESFSDVAGKRYYAEGELAGLSFSAPGWGYSVFANTLLDIGIENPTVPFFDVRAYAQLGAVGGFSFSLFDYALDIGVSGKIVRRAGAQAVYHVVDFAPLLEGDFDQLDDEFSTVSAFGADIGAIYHYDAYHAFPLNLAVTLANIGGLDFDKAGEVPMTLNLGASTELEVGPFDLLLATDMLDLAGAQGEEKDFLRDFKFGAEVGLFKLYNGHYMGSLRVGLNGVYFTYGFSINMFGLMMDYAQWSEEVGSSAGDKEDRRQAIRLSLVF